MLRRGLLAAALLGGCAELKRPPPLNNDLGGVSADPVRGAIYALGPEFADRGRGLAGKPAETAEAAARLEFVTDQMARNPRYAVFPEGLRRDFLLARNEVRDALGLAPNLAPQAAIMGLTEAAAALRAGNEAAAAAALPAPGFRPGGAASVARLSDIGPLPQAAIATGLAVEAVTQLDQDNAWARQPLDEDPARGMTPFGGAGYPSRGY
jgi:hypothetical protein